MPLADALLPFPTNKERMLQPGKITGTLRGDCGMPVASSVVVLGCLCLSRASFPASSSSLPLGFEATCKQQHLDPEGWLVLCSLLWGPPVFAFIGQGGRCEQC